MKKIIFLLGFTLLAPLSVRAYQCPLEEAYYKDEIFQRYESSDMAVVANIAKIETRLKRAQDSEYGYDPSSYQLVQAKIKKAWKSESPKYITIKDTWSLISGFLPLNEGEEYLLYLDGPDAGGFYSAYTCDIEVLGKEIRKQKNILSEIESEKILKGKYFEVQSRLKEFISYEYFKEISAKRTKNTVTVKIELQNDIPNWVIDNIIQFIKYQVTILGGKIHGSFKYDSGKNILLWVHESD